MKFFNLFLIFFVNVSLCLAQNDAHKRLNIHEFVVQEVLQTKSYTYLLAREGDKTQWLAMPKIEATIGETYFYIGGIEMRDFKSSELDRTFNSVMLLQGVENAESLQGMIGSESATENKQKIASEKENMIIDSVPGTITIAELLGNKEKYVDKVVKIKGKVVKYNSKIMGKNWIHLQDGTEWNEEFDLTITSDNVTKIGDNIIVEGKLSLDKDFGSGYFYKVIMEEAKILNINQ